MLFPDGHDPDSYAMQLGSSAFKTYIENNRQKDFILYKTTMLLKDAGNDPIKRSGVIREVVESIAKIPDSIKASVFVRECSSLMQIEERVLIAELNKMRLAKQKKESVAPAPQPLPPPDGFYEPTFEAQASSSPDEAQEKEIIRLLLTYGNQLVNWDDITDTYIAPYVITNLSDVEFDHPQSKQILEEYKSRMEKGELPTEQDFIKHPDAAISELAISLISSPYVLSDNWYAKRKIYVKNETENLRATILGGIFHLKKRKVDHILKNIRKEIQAETDADNQSILMQRYLRVKEVEKGISAFLGSVIVK